MSNLLAYPISLLYHLVTRIRNLLFDTGVFSIYRSKLPVISVGNITAGGNGKTPCVIYLCQKFLQNGRKPIVLSRGYGGSVSGPYLIKDDDSSHSVGDEPLLILRKSNCPVVVSRSRVDGAKYIEKNNLGDVIILDDGFQHRWLWRDLDIVCIFSGTKESVDTFLKGELLPLGRFREDRDRALARATCVVFTQRSISNNDTNIAKIQNLIPKGFPTFKSKFSVKKSLSINSPVCVVSAIANPEGFFQTVQSLGLKIQEKIIFPDHHLFSASDIEKICDQKISIICTEKDWIKLKEFNIPNLHVLEIDFEIEEEIEFDKLLNESFMR